MNAIPESAAARNRFPLGVLVCVFCLLDFATPFVMAASRSSADILPVIGILLGCMAGQFGLLAIWGVLGPGRALVRLTVTFGVCLFMMTLIGIGLAVSHFPGGSLRELRAVPLFLPLFLLAAQLPLWVLRVITGRRIVDLDSDAGQAIALRQFELRHLMAGTLLVSLALGLASSGLLIIGNRGASNWYFLLAACLTASVVSLLATLPCLWAGMTARNKDTATVLVAIYTLQMSLFGVIHTNRLSGGGIPGSVAVMLCLLYATPMVVILGTLHVARLSGYAFIRQRDPQAAVEGGSRFAVGDEVEDGTELAGKTIVGAGEPGYSSEKSRDA